MSLEHVGRIGLGLRRMSVAARQGRRLARWALQPDAWPQPRVAAPAQTFPHRAYSVRVPIEREDPHAHPVFEAGKRHNLALAAPAFDGLVLSPAHPLSFWRALGRLSREAGYASGMELQGGCIVPSIGGGICLLSNALFVMAARLGWHILERHGHSMEAVPAAGHDPWGLDATVFWPHIDLRVAPRHGAARLSVTLTGGQLCIHVDTARAPSERIVLQAIDDSVAQTPQGRRRRNKIIRRVFDRRTQRLRDQAIVAVNDKRILHDRDFSRSCLTCNKTSCDARKTAVLP